VSLQSGLTGYYKILGIRGVAAICSHRLTGMPKEITVQPSGLSHPVHLRIRTSDMSLYRDLLLKDEYAMDLPFTPRTIVDAGANSGMAALYYANKYPDAAIVAIEPEASNFRALVKNCRAYPNIVTVWAALWSEDGEVHIGQGSEDTHYDKWAYRVVDKGNVVRAISINTLMTEIGIKSIDLLKVDIEGAEIEVFRSAPWMSKVRAIAIELHDHIQPGCSAVLAAVTEGWKMSQRGEIKFLVRY
jgi:FkbM family methyltransferase